MRQWSWVIVCLGMIAGCGEPVQFSTGYASDVSARDAARSAFDQAVDALGDRPLKGILFAVYYPPAGFAPATPEQYSIDTDAEVEAAEEIAKLCKERGIVPNVGLRGRGITREGVHLGRGISVLAIGGGAEVTAALVPIKPDRNDTAADLAKVLNGRRDLKSVFLLGEMSLNFAPGADANGFASTLCKEVSSRPLFFYAGGMNDPAETEDVLGGVQFYDGEAYTGGLAMLAIGSPRVRLFPVSRHEFQFAATGVVTGAKQGWVTTIDNQSALSVYRKRRGMVRGERLVPDSKYPVAIRVGSRRYVTMVVDWVAQNGRDSRGQKSTHPAGSIRFRQPVEAGSVLDILSGGDDAISISASVAAAARRSLDTALDRSAQPGLLWISECHQRISRWCHNSGFAGALNPAEEALALQAVRQTIDSRMRMDRPDAPKIPIFGIVGMGTLAPFGAEYNRADHVFQQNVATAAIVSGQ